MAAAEEEEAGQFVLHSALSSPRSSSLLSYGRSHARLRPHPVSYQVPYLITINTSVFTDYTHRNEYGYGIKVYDKVELASFTFAAIVDDKKDNGTLQYMNTDIADAWKGPMQKGVFLTCKRHRG
jgi:hypothetical protein